MAILRRHNQSLGPIGIQITDVEKAIAEDRKYAESESKHQASWHDIERVRSTAAVATAIPTAAPAASAAAATSKRKGVSPCVGRRVKQRQS